MKRAQLVIALFGFVLISLYFMTAGKSVEERRIEKVMSEPNVETSAEACHANQPCSAEFNEAGTDDGFY